MFTSRIACGPAWRPDGRPGSQAAGPTGIRSRSHPRAPRTAPPETHRKSTPEIKRSTGYHRVNVLCVCVCVRVCVCMCVASRPERMSPGPPTEQVAKKHRASQNSIENHLFGSSRVAESQNQIVESNRIICIITIAESQNLRIESHNHHLLLSKQLSKQKYVVPECRTG